MSSGKYDRSVTLLCPTCGSAEMRMKDQEQDMQIAQCVTCGLEIERQALIDANGENIAAHVQEIGQEMHRDFAAELKRMLRDTTSGSKHFKVK
jgi:predicted RNA-binding Zn-ribbon protein involved in translation (DUF1610 family)